jgi:hypothetical protein
MVVTDVSAENTASVSRNICPLLTLLSIEEEERPSLF